MLSLALSFFHFPLYFYLFPLFSFPSWVSSFFLLNIYLKGKIIYLAFNATHC